MYFNSKPINSNMSIKFGLTALAWAAAALYAVATAASVFGKWQAISYTLEGYGFIVRLIATLVAAVFTDATLHLSLPTALIVLYATIGGELKKGAGIKFAAAAAALIAAASLYIDYKVVNYAGLEAGDAAYKAAAGGALSLAAPSSQLRPPPLSEAKQVQAKVPESLRRLALDGNSWARSKVAAIEAANERRNQAAQVQVAAANAAAHREYSRATAEQAGLEKIRVQALNDEQRRRSGRGEKLEQAKQGAYAFLSILSSFGQLLALGVLSYMGFLKGLHRDKSFYGVFVNFLVVASDNDPQDDPPITQGAGGGQTQQASSGSFGQPNLSAKNSGSVRNLPQQMTVGELVEHYRNLPKKSLQDAYSKTRGRAQEYRAQGNNALYEENMEYYNKQIKAYEELYGRTP